jgi:hypothetical protein
MGTSWPQKSTNRVVGGQHECCSGVVFFLLGLLLADLSLIPSTCVGLAIVVSQVFVFARDCIYGRKWDGERDMAGLASMISRDLALLLVCFSYLSAVSSSHRMIMGSCNYSIANDGQLLLLGGLVAFPYSILRSLLESHERNLREGESPSIWISCRCEACLVHKTWRLIGPVWTTQTSGTSHAMTPQGAPRGRSWRKLKHDISKILSCLLFNPAYKYVVCWD